MKEMRSRAAAAAWTFAIVGFLALGRFASSSGADEPVQIGWGPYLQGTLSVAPRSLPAGRSAPVELNLGGQLRGVEGRHPPALSQLQIELDRNLSFDVLGYPKCPVAVVETQALVAEEYERACQRALVGRGSFDIEIAFPEGTPVDIHSVARLYNGGERNGAISLVARLYITVPVPSLLVVPIRIEPEHEGPFRLLATATIPKIAGGSGSIAAFALRIHKRFLRAGALASIASAACPDGKLQAHYRASFVDGVTLTSEAVIPCSRRYAGGGSR
jgi:hypothetical protein